MAVVRNGCRFQQKGWMIACLILCLTHAPYLSLPQWSLHQSGTHYPPICVFELFCSQMWGRVFCLHQQLMIFTSCNCDVQEIIVLRAAAGACVRPSSRWQSYITVCSHVQHWNKTNLLCVILCSWWSQTGIRDHLQETNDESVKKNLEFKTKYLKLVNSDWSCHMCKVVDIKWYLSLTDVMWCVLLC